MKVLILGAGVIGVTTAYYLVKAGHDVEVIERCENVAMETSFANAGQISPGYASPWAAPGVPLKAVKWLMMRHGPLIVRPKANPAIWRWLYDMLCNCTDPKYAINKARMVPLAEYSRDCLQDLRTESGIAYDHSSRGTLQLLRTHQQLDDITKDIEVLRQYGVAYKVLDRKGCIEVEPALEHARADFVGGLRLPRDQTGDCHLFTSRLAEMAAALGVRFSFRTRFYGFKVHNRAVIHAVTADGPRHADAYVLSLGSYTPAAVGKLGLRLPIYPVKGYSLTLPISDPSRAPVSTVMDETYKIAMTRLGDRVRIGGTAELAGYDLSLRPDRRAALAHSFGQLFPGAGDLEQASFWCGLRPMTPDGTPIIGSTPVRHLYLNTGHGTLGWTMACGSARIMADIISGNPPDLDVQPLNISRYGS